jgi:DNA-binding transcriptional regulator GbsR (MarR family)
MADEKVMMEIERKIYSAFSEVAASIGYSPLHGSIIAALLVSGSSLSLQDLARKTGYSTSMVSLSLDFLEVLGIIKKVKKSADRKLYIELNSDLLESLRSIILTRIQKSVKESYLDFEEAKKKMKGVSGERKKELLNAINILESQIKRLEKYINFLSKINLP